MKKNIVYILFVTLIFGCAKKKDDSDNSGTSQTDLYKAAASTASDEAVDSIVESGSTSNFSPLTNTLAVTRACTASAGSASVLITFTGANNFTFSKTILGASVDVSVDVAKSGTETRVWNPASCHSSGEYADISWLNTGVGNNLTLNIDLNRTINRTKTFTVTKNSKTTTKTATDNVVITGNRSISWATPTLSNNQVTRVKTISSQVTRERTFTRVTGATTSLTSTVTTDSANPLVVSVVRSNVLQTLLSKTINSGIVKVADSDGKLSSCTFSNVVYDFTSSNENKCLPSSGTITCNVYSSTTDETVDSTLVISFGQSTTSSVSISVDNATAEDYPEYNSKGCELESAT